MTKEQAMRRVSRINNLTEQRAEIIEVFESGSGWGADNYAVGVFENEYMGKPIDLNDSAPNNKKRGYYVY